MKKVPLSFGIRGLSKKMYILEAEPSTIWIDKKIKVSSPKY